MLNRLTGWDKGNAYVRECFERNKDEGGCKDMVHPNAIIVRL